MSPARSHAADCTIPGHPRRPVAGDTIAEVILRVHPALGEWEQAELTKALLVHQIAPVTPMFLDVAPPAGSGPGWSFDPPTTRFTAVVCAGQHGVLACLDVVVGHLRKVVADAQKTNGNYGGEDFPSYVSVHEVMVVPGSRLGAEKRTVEAMN